MTTTSDETILSVEIEIGVENEFEQVVSSRNDRVDVESFHAQENKNDLDILGQKECQIEYAKRGGLNDMTVASWPQRYA